MPAIFPKWILMAICRIVRMIFCPAMSVASIFLYDVPLVAFLIVFWRISPIVVMKIELWDYASNFRSP